MENSLNEYEQVLDAAVTEKVLSTSFKNPYYYLCKLFNQLSFQGVNFDELHTPL